MARQTLGVVQSSYQGRASFGLVGGFGLIGGMELSVGGVGADGVDTGGFLLGLRGRSNVHLYERLWR